MNNINIKSINKPNLWSYLSLAGCRIMVSKAEGEKEEIAEEEREILEDIIKRAELPNKEINKILENIRQALLNCGYELRSVKIRAISQVILGASETFGEIPFEVGLYFDPILNVPYIPGSTIKGAVRSATFDLLYRQRRNEGRSDEEAKREAEDDCRRIFGGPIGEDRSAGLVGFTDAYPVEKGEKGYLLYPDVMSPHYKSNTDTELDVSPTPIIYLTIAPGAQFQFYLFYRRERGRGGRRRLSVRDSQEADLAETPIQDPNKLGILDRGLLYSFYRGVGAKTSVGYSRFEILSYEPVR